MTNQQLEIVDRGIEEFSETLAFQQQLVDAKAADRTLADTLVLVEHFPVYTVGRGVPFQQPVGKDGVPWVEIGRGGEATFHGPGQIVGYPIFDLTQHGKDVHLFLRSIERALIVALKELEVEAYTREGLTGVWVKGSQGHGNKGNGKQAADQKIASIGIGVRRWVSFHGFALNVAPDLEYFRTITACGQDGQVMTSLDQVYRARGRSCPPLSLVKHELIRAFRHEFSFGESDQTAELVRPPWLKVRAPGSPQYQETREIVKRLNLHTVCEEARCPNMGECWSHHTATFMIMGDLCTRRCSFCSVKDGSLDNLSPLDPLEPLKVAGAIKQLGLKHVVITSVNRDDLEDMGARHFDQTVRAILYQVPECRVELLIPDMRGRRELVQAILSSGMVSVLNHNVETVPRLYREVRPGASFKRSLDVLRWAGELQPGGSDNAGLASRSRLKTKSGVMVGLGESKEEVIEVMEALRGAGCSILTVGQYLQPSPKQLPVKRFVTPPEFEEYKALGLKLGFSYVESGPLVRSSYHAWRHVEGEATPATGAVGPERAMEQQEVAHGEREQDYSTRFSVLSQ